MTNTLSRMRRTPSQNVSFNPLQKTWTHMSPVFPPKLSGLKTELAAEGVAHLQMDTI